MLYLFLSYALWIPSLLGLGCAFSQFLFPSRNSLNGGEKGLLAFTLLGFCGLSINFFFPLSPALSALALLLGDFFFLKNLSVLRRQFSSADRLALVLISLGVSLSTACVQFVWDTGYYHLPVVHWAIHYPVPLGVANLEGSYAHPSIWFVTTALFWLPRLGIRSAFSANSLLATFFYFALFQRLREFKGSGRLQPSQALALGYFLFSNYVVSATGALNPDLPVTIFALYCAFLEVRILEEPFQPTTMDRLLYFAILAVFAAAVKLTAFPSAVEAVVMLFLLAKITQERSAWILRAAQSRAAMFTFSFGGLWMVRGLLMSGCFAFPLAASCFPSLPWAIDKSTAAQMSYNPRQFEAIGPHAPRGFLLADTSWLHNWIPQFFSIPLIQKLILFSLLGFVLAGLARLLKREAKNLPREKSLWGMSLLSRVGALFFVFVNLPSMRYMAFYLLALACVCAAYGISRWRISLSITPFLLWGLLFFSLANNYRTVQKNDPIPLSLWNWPILPETHPIGSRETAGITTIVPSTYMQCWDLAQPCNDAVSYDLKVTKWLNHWFVFTAH